MPTEVARIDRKSARHTVFERLRELIESGVLEPGEVLKDTEIADQLGVSRTPVREALQMLERHGLIEVTPGRQTRVTPIRPETVPELYAPLGALMGCAAETAAERATAGDLAAMTGHNEALLAALEARDPVAARKADHAFHGVPLALAANPFIDAAIEPLLLHARRLETLYFRDTEPGLESYRDHERIIAAIRARDGAAARRLTEANFLHFWTPDGSGDETGAASDADE